MHCGRPTAQKAVSLEKAAGSFYNGELPTYLVGSLSWRLSAVGLAPSPTSPVTMATGLVTLWVTLWKTSMSCTTGYAARAARQAGVSQEDHGKPLRRRLHTVGRATTSVVAAV